MDNHRRSYWKTLILALLLQVVGCLLTGWLLALVGRGSATWSVFRWLLWTATQIAVAGATGWVALLSLGGVIALQRDGFETRGRPYFARRPREGSRGPMGRMTSRIRGSLAALRGAPAEYFYPGEMVEIRSLAEITGTLDSQGTLDGLPFMPEMTRFCGRRLRILRRVEKLNDYIWKQGLRRMHRLVLLEDLRCDGAFHGGCQANCHLRWHESWLRRPAGAERLIESTPTPPATAGLPVRRTGETGERYVCQVTELTANSTALKWSDPRVYLREVLTGNVRLGPFLTGASLMIFRWVQLRRGGIVFPLIRPKAGRTTPRGEGLALQPGELVRVRAKHEIEPTLNERLSNRGLRFDGEMLRYCGQTFRVHSRLERLIIEQTGKLVEISNPSVILEGTVSTGEYAAFNPENEHIFWREIWLDRVEPRETPGGEGHSHAEGA